MPRILVVHLVLLQVLIVRNAQAWDADGDSHQVLLPDRGRVSHTTPCQNLVTVPLAPRLHSRTREAGPQAPACGSAVVGEETEPSAQLIRR